MSIDALPLEDFWGVIVGLVANSEIVVLGCVWVDLVVVRTVWKVVVPIRLVDVCAVVVGLVVLAVDAVVVDGWTVETWTSLVAHPGLNIVSLSCIKSLNISTFST